MINDNHGSRMLARSRPGTTGATQVYSPPTNRRAIIYKIIIANTTALAANASVFLDTAATTYDQTTAVMYAKSVAANTTEYILFEDGWEIDDPANIAVQTNTSSALTFTVLGRQVDAL